LESFESAEESRLSAHRPGPARERGDPRLGGGLRHRRRGFLDCHIVTGIPERNGRRLSGADLGSDISLPAIEKARGGRYPENIAADLSMERLNRYFTKIEGGYQVNKNLREMCVFTRHNLIDDPPFSKLDLISCRNVLIYLGSVQKDIIQLFHYALKPTGFLMLGASEAGAPGDLFSVVDREHRIYARRETARKPHLLHARGSRRDARVAGNAPRRRP
jgi:predicted TPR repeat methyltransferase